MVTAILKGQAGVERKGQCNSFTSCLFLTENHLPQINFILPGENVWLQ